MTLRFSAYPMSTWVSEYTRSCNRLFSDNPTSEAALYDSAMAKMATAAEATDLRQRAEDNTKLMLYTLFKSLGYQKVDVRFQVSSAGV